MRTRFLIGASIALLIGSVGSTGCSEGSQDASPAHSETTASSPKPALTDLQAARAFLSVIRRYEDQRFDALAGRPMPAGRSCLDLQSVGNELRGRIAVLESFFRRFMQAKLTASLFEKLAQELDEIPTSNESLRTVAEVATSVAANVARKMRTADVDLCRELAAWQKAGWSEAGYNELLNAPATRFGVDMESYRQSINALAGKQREITRIEGLEREEALAITRVALYL